MNCSGRRRRWRLAAVPTPGAEIAAVDQGRSRKKTWPHKKPDSRKRRRSDDGDQGSQSAKKKARPWEALGICRAHHRFGDKAWDYKPPASGQETNGPGAAQRRRRRDAGSYHKPANGLALPGGYQRIFQPGSTPIKGPTSHQAQTHRP